MSPLLEAGGPERHMPRSPVLGAADLAPPASIWDCRLVRSDGLVALVVSSNRRLASRSGIVERDVRRRLLLTASAHEQMVSTKRCGASGLLGDYVTSRVEKVNCARGVGDSPTTICLGRCPWEGLAVERRNGGGGDAQAAEATAGVQGRVREGYGPMGGGSKKAMVLRNQRRCGSKALTKQRRVQRVPLGLAQLSREPHRR